jgi:hypothetical protein
MCEVHVPIKFTYLIVCLKQRNNAVQWWSSNHGHVSKHWNKGLSVISHFSHQYATKGISVIAQCYTQSRAKEREESQSYHSVHSSLAPQHNNPFARFYNRFFSHLRFLGKIQTPKKITFPKTSFGTIPLLLHRFFLIFHLPFSSIFIAVLITFNIWSISLHFTIKIPTSFSPLLHIAVLITLCV